MNTPRTRQPKRYTVGPSGRVPDGAYTSGIHNPEIAQRLGEIIAYWPLVEDQMILVFADLLEMPNPLIARQTFRSISTQQARIKIMRNLLERSPTHQKREAVYDEVIDEFASLNQSRNTYAHSLWWTLDGVSRVFIEEQIDLPVGFADGREVTLNELNGTLSRMSKFIQKLLKRYYLDKKRHQPSVS